MKARVQLFKAGKVFDEIVIASDGDDARRVALARNPGASIVHVTDVFDPVNTPGPFSSSSSRQPTSHGSGSSFNPLGFLGAIVIGLIGMGLIGLVAEDTDNYETETTIQKNQVQPGQPSSTYSPPTRGAEAPFFAENGIQEEAVDDLGQNWDK